MITTGLTPSKDHPRTRGDSTLGFWIVMPEVGTPLF